MNSSPYAKISEEKTLELWIILEEQNKKKYTFDEVKEIGNEPLDLYSLLLRILNKKEESNEHG